MPSNGSGGPPPADREVKACAVEPGADEPDTGQETVSIPTAQIRDIVDGPKKSMIIMAPNGRLMRLDPL